MKRNQVHPIVSTLADIAVSCPTVHRNAHWGKQNFWSRPVLQTCGTEVMAT